MKLKLPRTDIVRQLQKTRHQRVSEEEILEQVRQILKETSPAQQVLQRLHQDQGETFNNFNVDLLESGRVFHLSDIKRICIMYRLRFLDSKHFKAPIPAEAISRIQELEKTHEITLKGFKIIAPSKLLKLDNADDPLLFAPMGNAYFYLIHKWGRDLHPLRKLLMWPFRELEHFAFSLLALSFLLVLSLPKGWFSPEQSTTEFFMLFFFIFKWVCGLAIFFGVKNGKNFNCAIWRSRYYNA